MEVTLDNGIQQHRTRYRGTDLDGPTLSPEGLWVRGRDLNSLIGSVSFETAVWHLWFGRLPSDAELQALTLRMQAIAIEQVVGSKGLQVAAAMSHSGVHMSGAAAAGLLCEFTMSPVDAPWDADFDILLACLVAAPYLMRAGLGHAAIDVEPATTHAERVLRLAGGKDATSAGVSATCAIDCLLTAWHAGFGYITPTVLVPRCAIGTGVGLPQAIAAGLLSSGPKHVGAALEAMRWLSTLPADEAGIEACVDALFDTPDGLLFGFGHPLFVEDPRPPHLRALFAAAGTAGMRLKQYDVVCRRAKSRKGLNPNIDFITAAALLDAQVHDPEWGPGIALCARIAAMAAHAVERRSRPPFGVNSATARRLLAAVPVGWL